MDTNKLILLIDTALVKADDFVAKYYDGDEKPMTNTKKALQLLKKEVQHHPENINERVLRAICDIGATSVKAYYNTPLEDAIGDITAILYYGIPNYRYLNVLGMDFGKGDPI